MLTTNDVAKVYDTILSIPGMNDTVKLALKLTRRNVLLLDQVIARGLRLKAAGDAETSLLDLVPAEALSDLEILAADCLQKAGLTALSEKLKTIQA